MQQTMQVKCMVLLASVVTAVPKQFFSLVQILQSVKCRIL